MIEIKNLQKSYGKKAILENISFTINQNEVICLTGLNGTGKTTLMNCIMGLIPRNSGSITIDGADIQHQLYERISYIPDSLTMPRWMTVAETMQFMATHYPNWNATKADELLAFFRLEPDAQLKNLSKGNCAKVNFLLGLSLDADYYLMDEPFSGIDVFAREDILEVFTSKFVQDKGVLIATHHMDEVEMLLDRIVMLRNGRIVKDFYAEDIRQTEGKAIIDVMREVYQP
ncbi:ABC transporter ATP-binding protein [Trichococcus ilyis]|jgi:ABC-2 type transport system ATP-binding protein|uniref:ABC-2 type transport system ATP-binding protein n=1 Tax=Trichococcus ilyis TaxID=640938 RepID=A0A143YVD8_9LACT|nr:ABC transporter ATP-binding protein [Trichococcus ilyis]CZQ96809.1 abc transporter [Trichococcus ilyis]SEJ52798.1 ABC-2 type transport system ATP-binding protein [Trichococcus ilyis]